ncbi:uncharacterized protein LOC110181453 [Drosophila serrata]|uniref:uncharacterized protein LOC110181453 n=1 Tax=Drosophila serrata TaxID=7274 RepID=UPI000A1D11D4|nr:uncharacterized protein LOC110181453 [Drosophila serrata]
MSDINLVAYDIFRRDLAKIFRTFNSSTQTDFTEDTATTTQFELKSKSDTALSKLYDLDLD